MKKYLLIGAVTILVIAGGLWYGHDSQGKYRNTEFGISFSHPPGWHCKTDRGLANRSMTNQTVCDNDADGSYKDDPLVVIDIPFGSSSKGSGQIVSQSTITGSDASTITVTDFANDMYPGLGSIHYTLEGSESRKGFNMFALYGSGKMYTSAEEARGVLDAVAKSLELK